jgi:hypothetical protein
MANNAYRHVAELSPRAYPITLSPGRVQVSQSSEASASVELRDVWVFPEFFHAGIWLGAMTVCRTHGTISVTPRSACDVEFKTAWKQGSTDAASCAEGVSDNRLGTCHSSATRNSA